MAEASATEKGGVANFRPPPPKPPHAGQVTFAAMFLLATLAATAICAYRVAVYVRAPANLTTTASRGEVLAFAPDGRFYLARRADGLWLFPVSGGAGTALAASADAAPPFVFSPDGSHLAAAEDIAGRTRLAVWDAVAGRRLTDWAAPSPSAAVVAFIDNDRVLGGDGRVRFIRDEPGATADSRPAGRVYPVADLPAGDDERRKRVVDVQVFPGGRQALFLAESGLVQWWDLEAGRRLRIFPVLRTDETSGILYRAAACRIAPDGRFAVFLWRWAQRVDYRASRIDLADFSGREQWRSFSGPLPPAVSGDGRRVLIARVESGYCDLQRAETRRGAIELRHPAVIGAVAFTPGGRRGLAAGANGWIYDWDFSGIPPAEHLAAIGLLLVVLGFQVRWWWRSRQAWVAGRERRVREWAEHRRQVAAAHPRPATRPASRKYRLARAVAGRTIGAMKVIVRLLLLFPALVGLGVGITALWLGPREFFWDRLGIEGGSEPWLYLVPVGLAAAVFLALFALSFRWLGASAFWGAVVLVLLVGAVAAADRSAVYSSLALLLGLPAIAYLGLASRVARRRRLRREPRAGGECPEAERC